MGLVSLRQVVDSSDRAGPDEPGPDEQGLPENPELVAAIGAALRDPGPTSFGRVFEAVGHARLLIPLEDSKADEPSAAVVLVGATRPTGEAAMLAFTDQSSLDIWRPGADFAVSKGEGLVGYLLDRELGLSVNPAGPVSVSFDIEDLRVLREARAARQALVPERDDSVTLRPAPIAPGEAFVGEVRNQLAAHEHVAAAFLLVEEASHSPRRLVIGLEPVPGVAKVSSDEIAGSIGPALAAVSPGQVRMGVTYIRASNVVRLRQSGVMPIYEGTRTGEPGHG